MDENMSEIMIIGGGAAGMMCAIAAADAGHQVTLLEKNEKLGKKVFITGKGRCNITNDSDVRTCCSIRCAIHVFCTVPFILLTAAG